MYDARRPSPPAHDTTVRRFPASERPSTWRVRTPWGAEGGTPSDVRPLPSERRHAELKPPQLQSEPEDLGPLLEKLLAEHEPDRDKVGEQVPEVHDRVREERTELEWDREEWGRVQGGARQGPLPRAPDVRPHGVRPGHDGRERVVEEHEEVVAHHDEQVEGVLPVRGERVRQPHVTLQRAHGRPTQKPVLPQLASQRRRERVVHRTSPTATPLGQDPRVQQGRRPDP